MKKALVKWFAAALCGTLGACVTINVSVYFPEKDVKQAYKSVDEMLLRQGEEKGGGKPATGGEPPPASKPSEPGPQSMLFERRFTFSPVREAFAAESTADTLAVELSSMPEVLRAYDEMKARLSQLNALRDAGAVGETNQGLIAVRDPARLGERQPLVKAENDNRKTVIIGMARAILKINNQPQTKENIDQVLGKAAATYAETKQEAARPGWWIQLDNGRWVQK